MASGTLKRFILDFKGFSKAEEVAKHYKAVVKMTSNFHLGVDEGGVEDLLDVAPEELTNEELLELKREH